MFVAIAEIPLEAHYFLVIEGPANKTVPDVSKTVLRDRTPSRSVKKRKSTVIRLQKATSNNAGAQEEQSRIDLIISKRTKQLFEMQITWVARAGRRRDLNA